MWQRRELIELKSRGFEFENPFDVIDLFERHLAQWMGAKFAVTVDSCTHALELGLRYLKAREPLRVPKHTYLSVPMLAPKLGLELQWTDEEWEGSYRLRPYPIVDASLRLCADLHRQEVEAHREPKLLTCLSFQFKKRLPIGRGGAILTDSAEAYDWLLRASYDGRRRDQLWKDQDVEILGYHYYLTPEDAARGLLLLDELRASPETSWDDLGGWKNYPDLSRLSVFQKF